jgi:hypothetical protein
MKVLRVLVPGLLVALAACETTISSAVDSANKQMEAKGSPFRYVAQDSEHMALTLLPLPAGPTKAVPELKRKALEAIESAEFKKGRSVANLAEVRHLQDGREVWVLQTLGEGVAYVVSFENPSNPDSNVRMQGPTTYSK